MKRYSVIPPATSGFPIIPMVDIMLMLLLFYMLVSRYLPPTLAVQLPEATAGEVDTRPALELSIDELGGLALDGAPIDWTALPGLLAGKDPETLVRIAADSRTNYDYVVKALDAAAGASLTHIALETQPAPQDETQAPSAGKSPARQQDVTGRAKPGAAQPEG